MKIKRSFRRIVGLLVLTWSVNGYGLEISQYPALETLIKTMVTEDGYPEKELRQVLGQAAIDQKIIQAMNRQYEALPWHKYQKLFINQNRIDKGVLFWAENEKTLAAAEQEYGVPQAVMVALIGVETHYGTRMGNKRVLDALVTLTADFPRRSKFFGNELRTFLNTTRQEGIAPDSVMGSFAGAIGIPQFMPTSYEAYSVDFNGNGTRDLVNEMEDAIGSVANYLAVHGWNRDQKIFAPVSGKLSQAQLDMVTKRAKPKLNTQSLIDNGLNFDARGSSSKSALLRLTLEQGKRYFVGYRNFYAITRYNPSVNYAMAVTELSQHVAKARQGQ